MAFEHDPKNPHPQGTGAYWQWHRKNHPDSVPSAKSPQAKSPFERDAAARKKFYGGGQ